MNDIFISYSNSDRNKIEPIVQLLEGQGWSVWWDRAIPVGKTFDEVIEEALEASKCVVVIWSKNSVTSRWVKAEASEGAERNALAPVLLDDVKVPLEFRRIQAAKLFNWEGSQSESEVIKLIHSISAILGNSQGQSPEIRRPIDALPSSQHNIESSPALASPSTPVDFKPSNLTHLPQQELNQEGIKPSTSLTAKRSRRLHGFRFWIMLGLVAILVFTAIITLVIFLNSSNKNSNAVNNPAAISEMAAATDAFNNIHLSVVRNPIVDTLDATFSIDLMVSNLPEMAISDAQKALRVTIDNQEATIIYNSTSKDGFSYTARGTLRDKIQALTANKSPQNVSIKSFFQYGTTETIIEKVLQLQSLVDRGRKSTVKFRESSTSASKPVKK